MLAAAPEALAAAADPLAIAVPLADALDPPAEDEFPPDAPARVYPILAQAASDWTA